MSPRKSFLEHYFALTDYSQSARIIVYGVVAFAIIYGIDLLGHSLGWNWYLERLVCNLLEAIILAWTAAHLSGLREERIVRRAREIGYLNHHVRNSLSLIQMAAQQLKDMEKRERVVRKGSNRICSVLEQLSRNEDVSIDNVVPERYEKLKRAG